MRKFLLFTILVLAIAGMLFADAMRPGSNRTARNDYGTLKPTLHRDAPVWSFIVEPSDVQSSFFDYMMGSYNGTPVRVQDNGGVYMIFHGKETAAAQRRQYITYINPDGSINSTNYVGQTDQYEGYAGIQIDPETKDPLYAWHYETEVASTYDVALGMDVWHLLFSPGLFSTPLRVIPNSDWDAIDFDPPFEDDQFLWPYVEISKAPSYDVDGKRRVYVLANNNVAHSDDGNPSENVVIAYCDFLSTDIESGHFPTLEWNYITIPQMDDWNADAGWIRPFCSSACTWDGKFAIFGYLVGGEDYFMEEDPDFFVLLNDNYCEGDWEYYVVNSEVYVDNPQNQDGSNHFDATDLYFSFSHSGHMTTRWDSGGRLHFQAPYALHGTSGDEGVYWPYYLQMRSLIFDSNTEEFMSFDLYPKSATPNDGLPFIPWDVNEDGEVDEYYEEGNVNAVSGWPIYYYDAEQAFHENYFNIAYNEERGWMAAIWSDGLKNRYYNDAGDEDYVDWATVPEIMISISGDNGTTWSDPIIMNANANDPEGNFVEQLDGQIPCYLYLGDKIEDMGDNHAKLHIMYFNDNSFGSYAQNNLGDNNGGMVTYMAIDIDFSSVIDAVDEAPSVSRSITLGQNFPNPFNPETTINFNVPNEMNAELSIYNVRGQKIKTVFNGRTIQGQNTVVWNGTDESGKNVSSGVYFYRLDANGQTVTQKMVLIK